MASRPLHIADYARALADGTLPGALSADRTVYAFPPVLSASARGTPMIWAAQVRLRDADGRPLAFTAEVLAPRAAPGVLPAGAYGEITTESGRAGADGLLVGRPRAGGRPTAVRSGKNLGKANATNVATQALRDALGLYNAQLRRAGLSLTNQPCAPAAARPDPPPATSSSSASNPSMTGLSKTNPSTEAAAAAARRAAESQAAKAGPGPSAPPSMPNLSKTNLAAGPPSCAAAARPPPMLVKKLGETRDATLAPADFARGITVQRKYNGVRAPAFLARPADGGPAAVCLYSRTRGEYPGSTNIRAELEALLAAAPPVPAELRAGAGPEAAALYGAPGAGVYLDGEIYKHGESLRWISGQARREDDEQSLDYVVYDCFFPGPKAAGHDMPSAARQKYLDLFFAGAAARHVRRAENFRAASLAEAEALRDRFLAEGYEGAIARKDAAGYRYSPNNYHSANLVKLKPVRDAEFAVVGYTQGARGKDVGAVIWVCEVDAAHARDPADRTFTVVPKGMTYDERYAVHRCLGERVPDDRPGAAPGATATRFERDFRGRLLTVEYPERSTKTGKPTQAKSLAFRTYEGGPALDPVRRLYTECVLNGGDK